MSITVVGSSAFDDIETPRGSRKRIVGGSCIYFSLAASFKTKVNINPNRTNRWTKYCEAWGLIK